MNEKIYANLEKWVDKRYVRQAKEAQNRYMNEIQLLIEQGEMPRTGWKNDWIERFLAELSAMDSNNFEANVGLGEREARIYSDLVAKRHYYFSHGIGRSGEISASQPKAAGSSIILKLTNSLCLHALRLSGMIKEATSSCLVMPMATGMTLTLVFLALKQIRPNAKYIIWPRIDQKSCFKCMLAADLEPIIIENVIEADQVRTDVAAIERALANYPLESILCIFSTTSCFAPRTPDKIIDIGALCSKLDIPHVINNAYGVQSSLAIQLINRCIRKGGRIDVIVQSTDKNFLVPVGGAIITGPNTDLIERIGKNYPGRACIAPILDLFMTLLSMGQDGWKKLLDERNLMFVYMRNKFEEFAAVHDCRLLDIKDNDISLAIDIEALRTENQSKSFSSLGAMLFTKCVSGTNVIDPKMSFNQIHTSSFVGYGSHHIKYPFAYLTAAAALGIKKRDIDTFIRRTQVAFEEFKKNQVLQHPNFDSISPILSQV